MAARYYFLLSALPTLPRLGEPLPLGPRDLLSIARSEDDNAAALIDGIIAELDIWALTSTIEHYEPISRFATDLTTNGALEKWNLYETHLLSLADRLPCPFLKRVTLFDLLLRAELVKHRSTTAPIPPFECSGSTADLEGSVAPIADRWSRAPSIHGGYNVLTQARYDWLMSEWPLEPFGIDELCVYGKTLTVLYRARTEAEQHQVGER